jgi:hypothetical protein
MTASPKLVALYRSAGTAFFDLRPFLVETARFRACEFVLGFPAMASRVGSFNYGSPTEGLAAITRMVRTGLTQDGTVTDLQEQLSATIARLSQEFQQTPTIFPLQVDAIRLHTVEAEHLYQSGLHREAAAKLKPFWDSWAKGLSQWKLPDQPLEPSRDRYLLRQKIWALMHYVFFDFYAVQAEYYLAIQHFHAIERVIGQELEEQSSRREDRRRDDRALVYKPNGTWAVFH